MYPSRETDEGRCNIINIVVGQRTDVFGVKLHGAKFARFERAPSVSEKDTIITNLCSETETFERTLLFRGPSSAKNLAAVQLLRSSCIIIGSIVTWLECTAIVRYGRERTRVLARLSPDGGS